MLLKQVLTSLLVLMLVISAMAIIQPSRKVGAFVDPASCRGTGDINGWICSHWNGTVEYSNVTEQYQPLGGTIEIHGKETFEFNILSTGFIDGNVTGQYSLVVPSFVLPGIVYNSECQVIGTSVTGSESMGVSGAAGIFGPSQNNPYLIPEGQAQLHFGEYWNSFSQSFDQDLNLTAHCVKPEPYFNNLDHFTWIFGLGNGTPGSGNSKWPSPLFQQFFAVPLQNSSSVVNVPPRDTNVQGTETVTLQSVAQSSSSGSSGPCNVGSALVTPSPILMGSVYRVSFQITNHDSIQHECNISIRVTYAGNAFWPAPLAGPGTIGINWSIFPKVLGFDWSKCFPLGSYDVNPQANGKPLPTIVDQNTVTVQPGTMAYYTSVWNHWNWLPPLSGFDEYLVCSTLAIILEHVPILGAFQKAGDFLSKALLVSPTLTYHFSISVGSNGQKDFDQKDFDQSVSIPSWKYIAYFSTLLPGTNSVDFTLRSLSPGNALLCGSRLLECIRTLQTIEVVLYELSRSVYSSALDPSEDFTEVYNPTPLALTNGTLFSHSPSVASLDSASQQVIDKLLDFEENSRAVGVALTRYERATESSQESAANTQLQVAIKYSQLRDTSMEAFLNLAVQWMSTNNLNLTISQSDAQAAQSKISSYGFPSDESALFDSLGLSNETHWVQKSVFLMNATMTGDRSIASDLVETRMAFQNFTIALQELAPKGPLPCSISNPLGLFLNCFSGLVTRGVLVAGGVLLVIVLSVIVLRRRKEKPSH